MAHVHSERPPGSGSGNVPNPYYVKHLTCHFFYRTGYCKWGDQCKYAHEDTGYYADPPMLHRNGHYVAGKNADKNYPVVTNWHRGEKPPPKSDVNFNQEILPARQEHKLVPPELHGAAQRASMTPVLNHNSQLRSGSPELTHSTADRDRMDKLSPADYLNGHLGTHNEQHFSKQVRFEDAGSSSYRRVDHDTATQFKKESHSVSPITRSLDETVSQTQLARHDFKHPSVGNSYSHDIVPQVPIPSSTEAQTAHFTAFTHPTVVPHAHTDPSELTDYTRLHSNPVPTTSSSPYMHQPLSYVNTYREIAKNAFELLEKGREVLFDAVNGGNVEAAARDYEVGVLVLNERLAMTISEEERDQNNLKLWRDI